MVTGFLFTFSNPLILFFIIGLFARLFHISRIYSKNRARQLPLHKINNEACRYGRQSAYIIHQTHRRADDREHDDRLVILHTNDTHSHIDPLPDNDMGGVARRKVLIDSVRAAEPNVLLVDAGDIVQGTLYFHLYKGEVEQRMLNELGYDVQILGAAMTKSMEL